LVIEIIQIRIVALDTPAEVWLFARQGRKISETRFRQCEKNKNKTFFTAAAKPPQ
jgi:hypothetical protein